MLTKGEEYKEGDDKLAFRKLRRMDAQAVSVSVIPKDVRNLKTNLESLMKKFLERVILLSKPVFRGVCGGCHIVFCVWESFMFYVFLRSTAQAKSMA